MARSGSSAGPPTGCSSTPASPSTTPPPSPTTSQALGVSHLYLSPILQAAPGSTHGYDVVDPTRVNVELGGESRPSAAAGGARTGRDSASLLDVVPNHMAITGRDNMWWWDVLENGPSSVYAAYFDVDWDPPESKLRNLVLMPILGDHYGRALDAGELALSREGGSFVLRYFDHELPVAPRSLDLLLEDAARRCTRSGAGRRVQAGIGNGDAAASRRRQRAGEHRQCLRPAAAVMGHRRRERAGAPPGQGGPPGPAGPAV